MHPVEQPPPELTLKTLADFNVDAVKRLSAEWNLGAEMEEWALTLSVLGSQFTTTHQWNGVVRNGYFHPSSLAHPCDMYLFLAIHGEKREERRPASAIRVLNHGTALHLLLHYYAATHATVHSYSISQEHCIDSTPEAKRLRLAGHADELIERAVGATAFRAVIDYKSTTAASFDRLKKASKVNVVQLNTYMHALDVPVGVLLYINKDATTFRSFVVPYDEVLWKSTESRIVRILDLAIRGKYDQVQKKMNKGCGWCPYFNVCKPEEQWTKTTPTSSMTSREHRSRLGSSQ